MSVKIYQDLRKSIEDTKPELLPAFVTCRGKEEILAFLETHYPLPEEAEWKAQLVSRAPLILKGDRSLIVRKRKENENEQELSEVPRKRTDN